ncbi:TPA: GntR family transcriptional regulator, partial [Enterococcus faecium]|nr:GntR family transcriptional regulator [Enterococcus faecium]
IMEQHYDLLKALVDKKPEEARFQTGLHLHMMLKEQETVTQRYPEYFQQ